MTNLWPKDSHVFQRELDRQYPMMVRAEGYRLYDDEGREYLDAIGGGAAVCLIGYGIPEVIDAVQKQVAILPFVHNQKFTNPWQEELADALLQHAPSFNRVIFCQGGGEANETALRLVRSYHVERGETSRWNIISPAQAYHGSTIATLALTGRPALQYPYQPYIPEFLHVPPVDLERDPDGEETLATIERMILDNGPETIAAFWCEAVSAAANPAYRAPDAFYAGVGRLAERYGFLIVVDEVVTGVGRTGTFFASDKWPIRPDVVTTAKGLGGGYVPMGAVLTTERVYHAVAEGSRDFSHGHTFNGYPLGCAVGLAILRYIDEHQLIERVAQDGPTFLEMLHTALHGCPMVNDVRGEGFLFGVNYRDENGAFFDPSLHVARRIDIAALAEGVLTYSSQPTADGYQADQTVLSPSFLTTEDDWREIARRFRRAIEAVASDVQAGTPVALVVG